MMTALSNQPKKSDYFVDTVCQTDAELLKTEEDRYYVLALLLKGSSIAYIDGKQQLLAGPAFICLDRGQTFVRWDQTPLDFYQISFDPLFLNRNLTEERIHSRQFEELCDRHDFFRLQPFLRHDFSSTYITGLSPELLNRSVRLFAFCREELYRSTDWYWSCRLRSNFMDLLHIVEQLYYHKSHAAVPSPVQDVQMKEGYEDVYSTLMHIWADYADPDLTAQELSRRAAADSRNLVRRFKLITGKTISAYILDYRLYAAQYKLRFTQLSVQEISNATGFQSAAYFCKIFKQRNGMTPNQFRSQVVSERIDAFG
ncbi:MAG: helix-turn-helix transcriptional regulator [Clostridiales bacterium]|nr:helix-turn-helix transcriptional regulator [Clostridiales bacterium]